MGRPKGVIRQIADEAGVDPATVRRALAEAGTTQAEAAADFAKAVKIVTAFADTDRVIGHASLGRGETMSGSSAYVEAKAQAERHRARRLELMNLKAEGELVDRNDVTETCTRIFADLRVALMAIGVRLAPRITGQSEAKTVARLVEDEIRSTLTTFTRDDNLTAWLDAGTLR
ncbi:hypothetical protein [Klebsiella pneumoniae]|uniref:hypothetical protein n=2 Tax=Klebsiella pneumoniae TaxID=573 RepID=UPI00054CFAB7|nr:hypothetical protein [Klebsiella pneumoniae]HAQ83362.1 hypothetical protein [Bradyrhizobium sp.]HAR17885.1 hypothetical protein [Bradyrhizobium sp.]HAR28984.1 hypothetical protein [Bradyrhizobium sp.]HBY29392.1 hypothetical protein [Bradyrhizobium sp.]